MRKIVYKLIALVLSICMLGTGTGVAHGAGAGTFADVAETQWYYDAVQYAYEKGFMNGTGNGAFSPDEVMTRGMLVTVLHNLEGKPEAPAAGFMDVQAGMWYAAGIAWASANGIVAGYSTETFGPEDVLTREQLATILFNFAKVKEFDCTVTGELSIFTDAEQVSAYAVEPMKWAVGVGLISGFGGNVLAPGDGATRAQAAAIMMNLDKNVIVVQGEQEEPEPQQPQQPEQPKPSGGGGGGGGGYTPAPVTHTVQFNSDGGSAVPSQTVVHGQTATRPEDPTKDGWEFFGWFCTDVPGVPYSFDAPVVADITVIAYWAQPEEPGQPNPPVPPVEQEESFVLRASKSDVTIGGVDEGLIIYLTTDADVDYADVYLVEPDADIYDIAPDTDVYDLAPDTVMLLGCLFDDGDWGNTGDDMMGDGTYSFRFEDIPTEECELTFVAVAGDKVSNKVTVVFHNMISEAALDNMQQADNQIRDVMETISDRPMEEQKDAVADLIGTLNANGLIVSDSVAYSEDGEFCGFEYSDGVLGGIMVGEFKDDFNARGQAAPMKLFSTWSMKPSSGGGGGGAGNIGDDEIMDPNVPGVPGGDGWDSTDDVAADAVGKAVILNSFPAFESNPDNIEYRTQFYEELQAEWEDSNLRTTLDTDVTVGDYKNLDKYDVVCLSTHGSTYTWKESYPAICLAEQSTKNSDKAYSVELKKQQIVKVNGCYWILPSFFEGVYGDSGLDGKFVFAECCQFMGAYGDVDKQMAEALTDCGAEAVVGFHNSVYATYSRELMRTYVNELVDGATAEKALLTAKNEHGSTHKVWYESLGQGAYDEEMPVAYPVFGGDPDAVLIHEGLKNGDFELSAAVPAAPTYWGKAGDVRTLTGLGEVKPYGTTSKKMAVLTTGVGSKEDAAVEEGTEGSRIYQTFVLPDDASALIFDYNYISEEPMEFVYSIYDDTFMVRVSQGGEVVYQEKHESINESQWFEVSGINFDEGDETVYQTGWKTATIDVSAWKGERITLCFIVYDMGDSIYDSACVLDNVRIE